MQSLDYDKYRRPTRRGFQWTAPLTWAAIIAFIGVSMLSVTFSGDLGYWRLLLMPLSVAIFAMESIFAVWFTVEVFSREGIELSDILATLGVWLLGPIAIFVCFARLW